MKQISIIALSVAMLLFAACGEEKEASVARPMTYTLLQGDQTPQLLEELNLYQDNGAEIASLPVPRDVLFYEPFVLSLSTGSTAIDAYLLDAPWVKRYSATGWLAPINQVENSIDLSAFRQELIEMTSFESESGRQVLAVPFETKGNLLFYRKDLLEAHGFTPPETWEQMIEQCQAIEKSLQADSPRFGFLFHGQQFANDFYPIIWGFGGSVTDDNGSLSIASEANIDALRMVQSFIGSISPSLQEMEELQLFSSYQAVERLFASGEAIFMINWNNRWGDLERGLAEQTIGIEQIGVCPIPSLEGEAHFSNIGSFSWGINYFSQQRQAALHFIDRITSYEAQKWRALKSGAVPARLDVLQDPEVRELAPAVIRQAEVFEKTSLRARPFQREIVELLDNILQDALRQNIDPRLALEGAQKEVASELAWMNRHNYGEGK
jgi:multiple sugar transport system substrate-binding protein